jgi:hypothetical protein
MPPKADSPLIVNSNAMLTLSVAGELLEPVSGWNEQVLQRFGRVQHQELTQSRALQLDGKCLDPLSTKDLRRSLIAEALNHSLNNNALR